LPNDNEYSSVDEFLMKYPSRAVPNCPICAGLLSICNQRLAEYSNEFGALIDKKISLEMASAQTKELYEISLAARRAAREHECEHDCGSILQ
jgi:hypothetical protein